MNKVILKKWEAILGISSFLYFSSLSDESDGIHIFLETEQDNEFLEIFFDNVLSYRKIDEGDLMRIFDESNHQQRWNLYIILNSDFLENFHYNSYYIHKEEIITHFAIYTASGCVDVLSTSKPIVQWIIDSK